jgi:hypothetical protein
VLGIGSERISRIIIANRKLSFGMNMGEHYRQEEKCGQNGPQRVVSVIVFWQTLLGNNDMFGCSTNRLSACWNLFPTLIRSSKSIFRNMETNEQACLHYLFSAVCVGLILSVTEDIIKHVCT